MDHSPAVPRSGSTSSRVEGIALDRYLICAQILWSVRQC
jgi:hypothetical protein